MVQRKNTTTIGEISPTASRPATVLPAHPSVDKDNKKINNLPTKILAGSLSGIINSLGTLGGMPISLFLLITRVPPIVIRGSLAAIFFIADAYVFSLSSFIGIVNSTVFYRALPLIFILPIGVFIGNKLFVKNKEETYRKSVFYFLIIISVIGIIKVTSNF